MLPLKIPPAPAAELWDEDKCEFVPQPAFKGASLQLEHSLIAVSRWESKYHKSFSSTKEKTMLDRRIDRKMTTKRKLVPQRGCWRGCCRTFSTVSSRPFS